MVTDSDRAFVHGLERLRAFVGAVDMDMDVDVDNHDPSPPKRVRPDAATRL